jgi:hypothetical protein
MKKNLKNYRIIKKLKLLSKRLILDINLKRSYTRFKGYKKSNTVNNEEGD